ncbi:lysophospholipid acyltransferase family protein [Streptoalloteichus hindustanus]|uniref:1-acyl-sn-glycerol-3-phosphate acyltransferases n=1 Tax=Streptoalloteichus hindustanus TaxID=2017 RepID=A0A1M5GN23_STRHI|nr:1-acyl-sn-glycerol-3-phosphate acyltransferase [Streptoalloteichus hindustanus]SHG04912.1 1-acyl-sn-glycerol-3-phosphate acyltransferases [Streptoalloteichus hindustanus]
MSHAVLAPPTPGSHPWMPVSPCGDHCIPGADETPGVGAARRALRFGALFLVVLSGVPIAALYPVLGPRGRQWLARRWFRAVLRAIGARLVVRGEPRFAGEGAGALVVGNHCSWLDIVALDAVQPVRMLAKREVRSWPVVGWFAAATGSVFVDRERLSALPGTVADLAAVLREGAVVGVFPEGTTWCGAASGRYRSAPFQAALDAGVPVRPVAVRYLVNGSPTSAVAFVGADTLWHSVRRVVGLRGLVVEVEPLPELTNRSAADRRELAALAERLVAAATYPDDASGPRPQRAAA